MVHGMLMAVMQKGFDDKIFPAQRKPSQSHYPADRHHFMHVFDHKKHVTREANIDQVDAVRKGDKPGVVAERLVECFDKAVVHRFMLFLKAMMQVLEESFDKDVDKDNQDDQRDRLGIPAVLAI